jgi:hypothetical protein
MTSVEIVSFSLSTGKPVQSQYLTSMSSHSSVPLAHSNQGNGVIDFDRDTFSPAHTTGDLLGTPLRDNHSRDRSATTGKLLALTESVVLVDTLRYDVEKLQMGLSLLTLSVQRLNEALYMQQNSGCCSSFSFVYHAISSTIGGNEKDTAVWSSHSPSGSYSISENPVKGVRGTREIELNGQHEKDRKSIGRINMPLAPSLQKIFRPAGYASVELQDIPGGSGLFSIQGEEDD